MTISMKIAAFDGKTVRERDDREATAIRVILVEQSKLNVPRPATRDRRGARDIDERDDEIVRSAVEGCSDRFGPNRFERAET